MSRLKGTVAATFLVAGALVTSACAGSSSGSTGQQDVSSTPATTTAATETTGTTTEATTEATSGGATTSAASSALPSSGRGATIVPVKSFEGGLTLMDEGLEVTDDDSGRQLFLFTSLGGDLYQVKGIDSSGENDPLCWRAPDKGEISPSAVVAGECASGDEAQQFTIKKSGKGYVIGRGGSGFVKVDGAGLSYTDGDPDVFKIVAN